MYALLTFAAAHALEALSLTALVLAWRLIPSTQAEPKLPPVFPRGAR